MVHTVIVFEGEKMVSFGFSQTVATVISTSHGKLLCFSVVCSAIIQSYRELQDQVKCHCKLPLEVATEHF